MKDIIKTIERIDDNVVIKVNKNKEVGLYVTNFNGISLENICIWKKKFPKIELEELFDFYRMIGNVVITDENATLMHHVVLYIGHKVYVFDAEYKYSKGAYLIEEVTYTVNQNKNNKVTLNHFPESNTIVSVKSSEEYDTPRGRVLEYDPDKKELIKISKEEK